MIALTRETVAGAASAGASDLAAGFGAGLGAGFGAGLGLASAVGAGFASLAAPDAPEPLRLDRPRRCTLPITALRVTPPNSLAIWLADCPSPHIFFNRSTRSSFHAMQRSLRSDTLWGDRDHAPPPCHFHQTSIVVMHTRDTRDRVPSRRVMRRFALMMQPRKRSACAITPQTHATPT